MKNNTSYCSSLKKRHEESIIFVSNNKYITWLENFTIDHPSFTDDSWLYNRSQISAEDFEMASHLDSFYEGIDNYARKNYIALSSDNSRFDNAFYIIKYNEIYYKIGAVAGQGTYFYCSRLEYVSEQFIDFNDIINNVRPYRAIRISKILDSITYSINDLLDLGLNKEFIINLVCKIIRKAK